MANARDCISFTGVQGVELQNIRTWPAVTSSLSSAKCAQSDSASIGHVTGRAGHAALDLFEWASAQSLTMREPALEPRVTGWR